MYQVTSVGINTEWGLLMATISEDTGEETPLQVTEQTTISSLVMFQFTILLIPPWMRQVRLNGVATFIGIVGLAVAASVLTVLLIR